MSNYSFKDDSNVKALEQCVSTDLIFLWVYVL